MILNIANMEAFQWKVSACYLVRICYPKAGKEKEKLRSLYFKLCDDETPILKELLLRNLAFFVLLWKRNMLVMKRLLIKKNFLGKLILLELLYYLL